MTTKKDDSDFNDWLAGALKGDFGDDQNANSNFSDYHHWHHEHYWVVHQPVVPVHHVHHVHHVTHWPVYWGWLSSADSGNTPLHDAILAGNGTLAQELIDNNADVNAKNKGGVTPLHLAVADKNRVLVRTLIEKGANATAVDNDGKTPEAYSLESTIKDETEKTPAPREAKKVETRRRREAPIGGSLMQLSGNPQQVNNQAQIAGPGNEVSKAFMPSSAAIGDATLLLELAMRKLTGAKAESASQIPLTEDQFMSRRVDEIDGKLSDALNNFSGFGRSSGSK